MTAPHCKRPLTDEIVDAFAAYWLLHPYSWGTFHVCLEDGNWTCGAVDPKTDEERELAAIFDELTPSQRRKLRRLVGEMKLGVYHNRAPMSLEERRREVDEARGRYTWEDP